VRFRIIATSEVAHRADIRPMSPHWPPAFRPAWRALVGWSARTPVGYGLAGSSDRQPEPEPAPTATTATYLTEAPPSAARQRVVLLPHVRPQPTGTRSNKGRTGRVPGMCHDDSLRQRPTQRDGTIRAIAASTQWHDAELALKVARHSFDNWLVAGHETGLSPALMHACHTHAALHEAARAITMLIETFRVETTTLVTSPAQGTDTPTRRR
jgi:hypothetical protein